MAAASEYPYVYPSLTDLSRPVINHAEGREIFENREEPAAFLSSEKSIDVFGYGRKY